MIICKGVLLIGQTPDFHFEPTIMILHIIDKPLIQVVNIYFLSWKFYCINSHGQLYS